MANRLADQVAVVTGGGAGIGQATSLLFADEGANVVVVDRYADVANETVEQIEASNGPSSIPVEADVSNEDDIRSLVERCEEEFGGIGILVNNAAIRPTPNPVTAVDDASWEDVFNVNLKGVSLCCKHLIPLMNEDGGAIVNVASVGAQLARKDWGQYDSMKGAIIALTRDMACDHADQGIRVNAISPGSIVTDFHLEGMGEEERERYIENKTTPNEDGPGILKRHALPEECASGILFLASDDASFVTGINLKVDGGKSQTGWGSYD